MNVFVFRPSTGEQLGPFTKEMVSEILESGLLSDDDLVCGEGWKDWVPVLTYLGASPQRAQEPEYDSAAGVEFAKSGDSTPPPLPPNQAMERPVANHGDRMKHFLEDMLVTAAGTATSYATAFVMWLMARHWDFALYSVTLFFILPLGAIGAGMLGATGYYFGAKLFGHRPSKFLLVSIVFVAASTYFLIYWMEYRFSDDDGFRLRERITFGQYLDFRVRNTVVGRHGRSSSTHLGNWGYAYALLQVVGFSLGGFAVFGILRRQPYCERCSRYLIERKEQSRYHATPSDAQAASVEIAALLESGAFQAAIDSHASLRARSLKDLGLPKVWLETQFQTRRCRTCSRRFLEFKSSAWNGQSEQSIVDWKSYTEAPITIS